MSGRFGESDVEEAALHWLEGLGYAVLHGPDISAGQPAAERTDPGHRDVILERRLRAALERLNPELPAEAVRAHLRVLVKRILRKHGYPPDKQEKATQTVLEQAAALSEGWAA